MSTKDNILQEKPIKHTLEPIAKPEDRKTPIIDANPINPQAETTEEQPSVKSHVDLYKSLTADPTPTAEQLEKEKKS